MKKKYIIIIVMSINISCSKTNPSNTSPINNTLPTTVITLDSIKINNKPDSIIISQSFKYNITGYYSNKTNKDLSDSVTISIDKNLVTLNGKNLIGAQSGKVLVTINYNTLLIKDSIRITSVENVLVDPRLKSNGDGIIKLPVLIINYLPTKDGINLDINKAPDGYYQVANSTLSRDKKKVLYDKIVEKNSIEEGTRFRDYGKNTTGKYVSIDVVGFINVFELDLVTTQITGSDTMHSIDHFKLFDRLNVKKYVEELGVKEIWITYFPKDKFPSIVNNPNIDKSGYYGIAESNMSSPISGDVSNSDRSNNDLPIYSKSYVVYGFNNARGVDTDLHNRGHQIEAQLTYIDNENLLWTKAFSPNDNIKDARLGNTHWSPNSPAAYLNGDTTHVLSDIMDWKPSGGIKSSVNVNNWKNIKYSYDMNSLPPASSSDLVNSDYALDPTTMWFIFWWQSIPGYNNGIQDNGKFITNWWDIFYNWDDNLNKGTRLTK